MNVLAPIVYERLKAIARSRLSKESAQTLEPTELVNEAFLRLIDVDVDWMNRAHFLAIAATMIRRILVDRARARLSDKRGGGARKVTLNSFVIGQTSKDFDLLDLENVMSELAKVDGRKAQIIELHYFGGLTYEEISEVLQLSRVTIRRDLTMARAWLLSRLSE